MDAQKRLSFGSAYWLDLTNAGEDELRALLAERGVPESVATDCLDPSTLPKVVRLPAGLFVLLRGFDELSSPHASSAQALTRKVALVWGEGFLLTIHRSPLRWLEAVRMEWEKKPAREPAQLVSLVHDLLEECLYTFEAPIDEGTESIARLEEKIFAERSTRAASGDTLSTAYLVKKRAFIFKRLLRLTRDLLPAVSKLGDPASVAVQSLKEEADRLFFYSDDLAESANDLVQLSISMSSNRMNELVRLLTIVSIFLLPLNLITGIYGMNFEHMPELRHPHGYQLALLTMVFTVSVTYLVLRRRGWIRTRSDQ